MSWRGSFSSSEYRVVGSSSYSKTAWGWIKLVGGCGVVFRGFDVLVKEETVFKFAWGWGVRENRVTPWVVEHFDGVLVGNGWNLVRREVFCGIVGV